MQKRKCARKIRAPEEIRVKGKPSPASMPIAIGLSLPCMAEICRHLGGRVEKIDGIVMWLDDIEVEHSTDEEDSTTAVTLEDDKAQSRRRFFGSLNAMRSRLAGYGVSPDDVKQCYAERFGVKGMSYCSPQDWAIAAAEVQAMVYSEDIFSDRIAWLRAERRDYG